jgi:hypothetical protein
MPTLTTRNEFQNTLNTTRKQVRGMFEDMSKELTALIVQYAGEDGKIPPDQLDELQRDSRAIIERYFVRRRAVSQAERQAENERLRGLITKAQRQLKRATKAQAREVNTRIRLLSQRLALLERQGVVLETITDNGQPVSPYARIISVQIRGLIRDVLRKHAGVIRGVLGRV